MSRIVSFTCSKCGSFEFHIDLADPAWFTGGSCYCGNCGAGLGPDADFFWGELRKAAGKAGWTNRASIRNAMLSLTEHLKDYSVLEKDEWLEVLLKQPDLAAHCPMSVFSSDEWVELLLKSPDLAAYCDWGSVSFSSGIWKKLLLTGSSLDAHCKWDVLASGDWVELLTRRPELDAHCKWDVIASGDWVKLLTRRPELDAHCKWDVITSGDWVELLARRPELKVHCKWDVITSGDWAELLSLCPELKTYCKWDVITSGDWVKLLTRRPELDACCKWDVITSRDWAELLKARPELAAHCDWKKISFSSAAWTELLLEHTDFDERCPWNIITSGDWVKLLNRRPELAAHCDWSILGSEDVGKISANKCIRNYIDFEELKKHEDAFCTIVEKLDCAEEYDWSFVGTGDSWCRILSGHPGLAPVCDWELLGVRDWVDLLSRRPELKDYCTSWSRFSLDDWSVLLSARPKELNDKFPFRDLRCILNYPAFPEIIRVRLASCFAAFSVFAFLFVFTVISLWGQSGWFSLFAESAKHAMISGAVWIGAAAICGAGYGLGWGPYIGKRWLNVVYAGFAAFSLYTICHWSFFFSRCSAGLVCGAVLMIFLFVFPLPGDNAQARRLSMCLSPFFAVLNWFLLSPSVFSVWLVGCAIVLAVVLLFFVFVIWDDEKQPDDVALKYFIPAMIPPLLIGVWFALSPVSSQACYKMAGSLKTSFMHASQALCRKGEAVDPDFARLEWLKVLDGDDDAGVDKAAAQGFADAQYQLGMLYESGSGVTRNLAEAVRWYRKAAEQGHAGAQFRLGECCYWGLGMQPDRAEAVKWYRKAAEQGHAEAKKRLEPNPPGK